MNSIHPCTSIDQGCFLLQYAFDQCTPIDQGCLLAPLPCGRLLQYAKASYLVLQLRMMMSLLVSQGFRAIGPGMLPTIVPGVDNLVMIPMSSSMVRSVEKGQAGRITLISMGSFVLRSRHPHMIMPFNLFRWSSSLYTKRDSSGIIQIRRVFVCASVLLPRRKM